jgi:hypothetical protein
MGFNITINQILRSDDYAELQVGKEYTFEKDGDRIFADTLPIWLTKKDWTALAEIQITSQTREDEKIFGKFKVMHIYEGDEQKFITEIFKRMYA